MTCNLRHHVGLRHPVWCVSRKILTSCSLLQRDAGFCSVLQCATVCCSVLQCTVVCRSDLQHVVVCHGVLHYAAVCRSVVQCTVVCRSVLQRGAVYCSVSQYVAECCNTWLKSDIFWPILLCVIVLFMRLVVLPRTARRGTDADQDKLATSATWLQRSSQFDANDDIKIYTYFYDRPFVETFVIRWEGSYWERRGVTYRKGGV